MKDEVKNNLIKAMKLSGLDEGLINVLNATEETDIEGLIEKLKPGEPKPFMQLVNGDKTYQGEFDRAVAQALKTREEKLKEEYNFVKKEGTPNDGTGANGTGAGLSKEFEQRFKLIEDMISNQKQTQTLERKKGEALGLLKSGGIPEEFIGLFNLEGEETVTDQFVTVKASFDKIKDNMAQTQGSGQTPVPQGTGGEPSQEFLDRMADSL